MTQAALASGISSLTTLLQRTGKECAVRVRGDSMSPSIPNGAEVLVAFMKQEDVRKRNIGDVLVFPGLDDEFIVHRLVGRGKDFCGNPFLVCRGDAHLLCDMPIRPEDVLGCVQGVRMGIDWPPVPAAPQKPLAFRLVSSLVLMLVDAWACTSSPDWRRSGTSALQKLRRKSY